MKTPMPPTLVRWLRFNSVGAIGSLFQLVALALIDRLVPHHTLLVPAAALELTVLHNFLWHRRWTWRTTAGRQPWLTPLVRFHVSNGLVSLAGNLVVMRLLVTQAHLPLLASNGIAIIVCSLANFWLGSVWAFAADSKSLPKRCLYRSMSAPCPRHVRRTDAYEHCGRDSALRQASWRAGWEPADSVNPPIPNGINP